MLVPPKPAKPHKNMPIVGEPPRAKKRKLDHIRNKPVKTTEDVLIHLKVDLSQLYRSQPQSISVVRNRLCPQCGGKGVNAKADNSNITSKCVRCFGRGVFPDEKVRTSFVIYRITLRKHNLFSNLPFQFKAIHMATK